MLKGNFDYYIKIAHEQLVVGEEYLKFRHFGSNHISIFGDV